MINRRVISIIIILLAGAFPAAAESEFSLRAAPVLEVPLGPRYFKPGMGAAAFLDWSFFSFTLGPGIFNTGIFAGGSFAGLGVESSGSISLFEGRSGAFARWQPFDRWAFRAGFAAGIYQYSWEEYSNTRPLIGGALGAEFHLSPYFSVFAEGGYTWRAFAESSSLSSVGAVLGLRINLSEIMGGRARVRGEKIEQRRIFPVSYAWYEQNPVSLISIVNNEPNAITDVNLSFFMDRYMGQPSSFAVLPRLEPGEEAEVPVTALFNEVMLDLTENLNANGVITIRYRSLGARKETSFPVSMPIYHRNALSWDDDRRAASFVSVRDPSARLFARYTASAVNTARALSGIPSGVVQGGTSSGVPPNVRMAAALFEALRLYGINYIIDPASSFVELSADESALDNLNYPYQTLFYRGGDCDDLSILFCSLLEALGIESAFITIPGHIYIAFDPGDNNWEAGSGGIIEAGGRRWMPVEITVPAAGFSQACRIGIRQWRNAGDNGRIYPMGENWKTYPPVSVPGAGDRLPVMPSRAEIFGALEKELALLSR